MNLTLGIWLGWWTRWAKISRRRPGWTEERKEAYKNLEAKKTVSLRNKAIDNFIDQGLKQQRTSKKKIKGKVPLVLDGAACWDPVLCAEAFRKVYTELFADERNSVEVQAGRLLRLNAAAKAAPRIRVPMEVLSEVLSKGRRKKNTAPGRDQAT